MNKRFLKLLKCMVIAEILVAVAGCKSTPQYANVLQAAEVKRENRKAALKEMTIEELHRELTKESERGLEPFNSMTLQEVVSRGQSAARSLAPLVKKADKSSLLSLLAVKKVNPDAYTAMESRFRLSVMIDALRTSKYFNTWGLPHVKWEDAAKAIADEKQAALQALKPLLSDKRQAPVWGSEDYAEYQRYQYRVCDYALALTYEARGEKLSIPVDPRERDVLIQRLAQ